MTGLPGQLIIISGPSGVGKTTVVRRLVQACSLPLELNVSATTRPPRDGEADGRDYHFLDFEEFQRRRQEGEFLECCEVYGRGEWYGTLRKGVETSLRHGKWVILEIDVEGAMKVVDQHPQAITILVRPASLEELHRRLEARQTESEEKIRERLARAKHELSFADRYRFSVINDEVDDAVTNICEILEGFRLPPPIEKETGTSSTGTTSTDGKSDQG